MQALKSGTILPFFPETRPHRGRRAVRPLYLH